MSEPYTYEDRQDLRAWAMSKRKSQSSLYALPARIYLRYEAILQAKDAQIAALVKAISRRCIDDQACIYADELQAAIEEATNAG